MTARANTRGSGATITKRQRELYLEALAEGATHAGAALRAGRNRRLFLDLRQSHESFRAAVAEAISHGDEMLEQYVVEIARGERECKYMPQLTALFSLLGVRQPRRGWRPGDGVRAALVGEMSKGKPIEIKLSFDPDGKADLSQAEQ